MIERISAVRLRKTGIFAEAAGDFRRFPPQDRPTRRLETESNKRSPGFPAYSSVFWGVRLDAGMAGWRRSDDRTRLQAEFPANREFFREFRLFGALGDATLGERPGNSAC